MFEGVITVQQFLGVALSLFLSGVAIEQVTEAAKRLPWVDQYVRPYAFLIALGIAVYGAQLFGIDILTEIEALDLGTADAEVWFGVLSSWVSNYVHSRRTA